MVRYSVGCICVNPCHPCSMAASPVAEAPEIRDVIQLKVTRITNLRSSAFICGSFFAEARAITCSEFIKVCTSQNTSPQSNYIPPSRTCILSEALIKQKIK